LADAVKRRVIRSWPWTIALATVLGGLLVVGLFRLSTAGGTGDLVFGALLVGGSLYALFRVLTSGVHILPSGLIIRELTRSTRLPWDRIRSITSGPSDRSRVYVPVLTVTPGAVDPRWASRRGLRRSSPGSGTDIAIDILGSYSAPVAQRRADELAAARKALSRRRS
jgi:hypothetical protein